MANPLRHLTGDAAYLADLLPSIGRGPEPTRQAAKGGEQSRRASRYREDASAHEPQAGGHGRDNTVTPIGLAGWMLVHGGFGKWTYGKDPNQSPTNDEVLDNFSLHWLTNTVSSGARLYWENRDQNLISAAAQKTDEITLPVAITVFPNDDLFRAPETWARRAFPSLIYFHEADRGGHFAAWEQPQLLTEELRAAFRSLR